MRILSGTRLGPYEIETQIGSGGMGEVYRAIDRLSPDHDNGYFVDGLADEVISDLSKVSALRVISRTSVQQFKGQARDLVHHSA